MDFLRNKEIISVLLIYLLITTVFIVAGLIISPLCALLLLICCCSLITVFLIYTARRYIIITRMHEEIDHILHSEHKLEVSEYSEGELSILASQIEKLLIRLGEQSERLTNDKKYLADSIADISHQIRTPLTSVRMVASFLGDSAMSAEKRLEYMNELNQLLNRIDWLINTLLKISKIDAKTAIFTIRPVNVRRLIDTALEPLMISIDLNNITLSVTGDDSAEFTGDFSWSVEALGNIINNCVQHTPGGTISITYGQNTLFTQITVRDNGKGFDKSDLPHLFERFYRGKNAGEHSIGIGLALARMVINRQNGTIKAENNPDGGACFRIRFYKDI